MSTNNRFLQSNLVTNNLASETTLKNVEQTLNGVIDVSISAGDMNVNMNEINGNSVVTQSAGMQTVHVNAFPTTQPVSGSVSVSNLTNPHPVSGTIAVSNLTNPHPVSGTIAVSNLANPHPISGTVAVSGTVNVNETEKTTLDDVIDATTKGYVMFAQQEHKAVEHAQPVSLDFFGDLRTVFSNKTIDLNDPVDNWTHVRSEYFSPTFPKFIEGAGNTNIVDNGGSLYLYETSTNYGYLIGSEPIEFQPGSMTEIVIGVVCEHYNSGTSELDFQAVGIANGPITSGAESGMPSNWIGYQSRRNYVPNDDWRCETRTGGSYFNVADSVYYRNPSSSGDNSFKLRIINYASNLYIEFYNYEGGSTIKNEIIHTSKGAFQNKKWYICNFSGSSSANNSESRLYSYSVKQTVLYNKPKILYDPVGYKTYVSEYLKNAAAINMGVNWPINTIYKYTTTANHTFYAARIIINILDNGSALPEELGGISALSNGLSLYYRVSALSPKIYLGGTGDVPIISNGSISAMCFDFTILSKGGSSVLDLMTWRYSFNKSGTFLKIGDTGIIAVETENGADNLSNINQMSMMVQGYEVPNW